MVLLQIDLQNGFSNDTVVLRVDRELIFHKKGVSTDYSLGRADSVDIQVPEGTVKLNVQIPLLKLSDTITLDTKTNVFLGISIQDEGIHFRVSNEMFIYF
jgi:hypothetical protein